MDGLSSSLGRWRHPRRAGERASPGIQPTPAAGPGAPPPPAAVAAVGLRHRCRGIEYRQSSGNAANTRLM